MIDNLDPRIQKIVTEISEAFGVVDCRGGYPDGAQEYVNEIWAFNNCTPADKKAVFNALYGTEALKEIEAAAGITVAELLFMMRECNIDLFTLTK